MVERAEKIGSESAVVSVKDVPKETPSGVVSVILTASKEKLGWLRDAVISELASQHTVDFSSPGDDVITYVRGCFSGVDNDMVDSICVSMAGETLSADYAFVIGGKEFSQQDIYDVSFFIINFNTASTVLKLPVRGTKKEILAIAKRIIADKFGVRREVVEPLPVAKALAPRPADEYVPPAEKASPLVPPSNVVIMPPVAPLPESSAVSTFVEGPPPPPDTFWPKWKWPLIFTGTAAAAGVAGGVLGVMAKGKESESHEAALMSDAFDIYGDAKNLSYASNGVLGLTAALAGFGVYFLIDALTGEKTEGSKEKSPQTISMQSP